MKTFIIKMAKLKIRKEFYGQQEKNRVTYKVTPKGIR